MRQFRTTTAAALLLSCLTFRSGIATPAQAQSGPEEGRFLQAEIARLNLLLAAGGEPSEQDIGSLLDELIDLEGFSKKAFGDYLERTLADYAKLLTDKQLRALIARHQAQLNEALRHRLIVDLVDQVRRRAARSVRLVAHRLEGSRGRLELLVATDNTPLTLTGELRRTSSGWRLVDLSSAGREMSAAYRELCSDILAEKYSPPVLVARLQHPDYIILDDFSTTPADQLPLDWGPWRDKDQGKPLRYQVETAAGRHFLAARDSGHSVILGKFVHWNPREYPIMTWCWKATALPPGGDERYDDTNDSAAGLYVIFSQNWLGVPKQLKYVWSSSLPVGEVGRRNLPWRPWFFVVESGTENLGQWTFEMVDLYAHHELKLEGPPSDRTIALALLTDANSTRSYAEAYYADLRVWHRQALEKGMVEDYCDCLSGAVAPAATD